jgi:hypothetical protein
MVVLDSDIGEDVEVRQRKSGRRDRVGNSAVELTRGKRKGRGSAADVQPRRERILYILLPYTPNSEGHLRLIILTHYTWTRNLCISVIMKISNALYN